MTDIPTAWDLEREKHLKAIGDAAPTGLFDYADIMPAHVYDILELRREMTAMREEFAREIEASKRR